MARGPITLKGQATENEQGVAAVAIYPGQCVGVTYTDGQRQITLADAGSTVRTFALEREELGRGKASAAELGGDVAAAQHSHTVAAYAVGEVVKVGHFKPGDHVNALVDGATAFAAGDLVAPAAGGFLGAAGAGTAIARANETAVAGDDPKYVSVEII